MDTLKLLSKNHRTKNFIIDQRKLYKIESQKYRYIKNVFSKTFPLLDFSGAINNSTPFTPLVPAAFYLFVQYCRGIDVFGFFAIISK